MCGVAHGRAEFGPRAPGNRSLLGDQEYDIKDTVKRHQETTKVSSFRTSNPREYADEYFEGPMNEYTCSLLLFLKHDYKSVTHVDGTARVQVVKEELQVGHPSYSGGMV